MRPEKEAIIKEIQDRLEDSGYVFLADCRGMKVETLAGLRGELRGKSSSMFVVKNSLFGAASKQIGWNDVEQFLDGPTAVITGAGDVSDVAKGIRTFSKKAGGQPVLKGGRFEGETLSEADVQELADLPSREVLYAMTAGTLAAPMSQLVGVMSQKMASVIYVLKAAADKKAASA